MSQIEEDQRRTNARTIIQLWLKSGTPPGEVLVNIYAELLIANERIAELERKLARRDT